MLEKCRPECDAMLEIDISWVSKYKSWNQEHVSYSQKTQCDLSTTIELITKCLSYSTIMNNTQLKYLQSNAKNAMTRE